MTTIRTRTLTTAVLLCACAERPATVLPTDSAIDHAGLTVHDVTAKVLSADSSFEHLTSPVVVGEHLWVGHPYNPPFFHVIDTLTGRVVASLGRHGQGPAEFEHLGNFFSATDGDTTAWAWDSDQSRVTRVSLGLLSAVARAGQIEIVSPKETAGGWVSPVGREHFLRRSFHEQPYFTIFSRRGDIVRTRDVELPGEESIPTLARWEALNGSIVCPTWDNSGFAMTYPSAGRIQMYDSLANPTIAVDVPYPIQEEFGPNPRTREVQLRRRREFYSDCAYSSDRLFALFSGRIPGRPTLANPEAEFDDESDYIHVFDLRGKLDHVLRLDTRVGSIAVDSAGRRIFATSFRRGVVYRIDLPAALRPSAPK
jgi:hypothetical protein